MTNGEQERHPFRFLLKFLLFAGLLAAIARVMASKKAEFAGLSDSEARAKFEEKLGPWIGTDKAAEVANQVVPKLKDAGLLEPDAAEKAMDNVKDAAGKTADAAKGTARKATKTAKEVGDKAADTVVDLADTATDAIGDAVDEAVEKIEEVSKKTRGR
ncbi:MAG: hypothetical protein WD895_00065 [Acidimicrobiia bacterium]